MSRYTLARDNYPTQSVVILAFTLVNLLTTSIGIAIDRTLSSCRNILISDRKFLSLKMQIKRRKWHTCNSATVYRLTYSGDTMSNLAFSNELLVIEVLERRAEYLEWEVTPQQFEDIQSLCSGNPMPSYQDGEGGAFEWALARSAFLKGQAQSNEDAGLGYCIPEHCRYDCFNGVVAYETTRGTVFMCFADSNPGVLLPKTRVLGFHHQMIVLVLEGIPLKSLDECLNLHRFKGEELERVCADRSAWDKYLVPLGFPAQQTYEEVLAERSLRSQSEVVPTIDEEFIDSDYDYEDYGTDDDYAV